MYAESYLHASLYNQAIAADDQNARGADMAVQLFRRALGRGRLSWLAQLFKRQGRELINLESYKSSLQINGQHAVGTKMVTIKDIRGTEGREHDFDANFNPRHERMRDRWVSVARARFNQTPLPAVELIQVGEIYFVRDGHHRISVARALGQQAIDAHVTVWD